MPDHIPPTEAELKAWRKVDTGLFGMPDLDAIRFNSLIAEIRRLRARYELPSLTSGRKDDPGPERLTSVDSDADKGCKRALHRENARLADTITRLCELCGEAETWIPNCTRAFESRDIHERLLRASKGEV